MRKVIVNYISISKEEAEKKRKILAGIIVKAITRKILEEKKGE